MTVTMKEVRQFLDPEEPDYARAAQLGSEALPHLAKLVKGADQMLAAKAVHLAGLVGKEDAVPVLKAAAASAEASVRVAAAAAARNLPGKQAGDVLVDLLNDADAGVRKTALKSVSADAPATLRKAVEAAAQGDASPVVRNEALRAGRRITGEDEDLPPVQDSEASGMGQGGGSTDFAAGFHAGGMGDGGMGGGSISGADVGRGEGGGPGRDSGMGDGGGRID